MTAVRSPATSADHAPPGNGSRAARHAEKRRSTAPAHPSRKWLTSVFSVALGLCGVALVGHAYVVGHGADVGLGGFLDDGLLKATTSSGTAVFVAFAIAVVAAWCFRRIRLERLATKPGRIEVPDFSVMTGENVDAVHLTALFRQRLATLRLQSPTPVPGSAPAADFLEVLGGGGVDVKNPLATLLSVLRATKPSHAWEVRGVLVEREVEPRFGVTVQVSRVPDLGAPPDAVYDYTWERAIRRAADRATAHILPHTRTCRSPWASWRGLVMPPALIEAYEHAVDMETRGSYDKALGAYYEALRHDPLNLPLRLQLGQLQEKLGLGLDALSTYQGIVSVAPEQERRRASAETWHVLLAAEYRRVVLLGGPALAHQWCRTEDADNCKRNAQRESLRERLRLELEPPLQACARPTGRHPVHQLLEAPHTRLDRERVELELRELFALYAKEQLVSARKCLEVARRRWHGEDRLPVTDVGLSLTGVCIDVRLDWLDVQLGDGGRRWIWDDAEVDAIERRIASFRPGMCRWHEHYTAACAFALPLLVDEPRRSDARRLLAARAIRELEDATTCADSGFFASRRDWLLAEDPDLDGLRPHPHFKAFEATYLPSGDATPRRPRKLQRLQITRYTDELLVASARRCAQLWHARGGGGGGDAAKARAWWHSEKRVWELTAGAAANYRHWRARLELLDVVDKLSLEHGHEPLDAAFRRYDEPSPDGMPRDPGAVARHEIDRSQARLRGLAALTEPKVPLAAAIDSWIDDLRAQAPAPEHLTHAAKLHSQLWESLAEWLSVEDKQALSPARRRFAIEIERTSAYLSGGWRG